MYKAGKTENTMELGSDCLPISPACLHSLSHSCIFLGRNVSSSPLSVFGRNNEQRKTASDSAKSPQPTREDARQSRLAPSTRQGIKDAMTNPPRLDDTDKDSSFALHSTPLLTILIHDCRLTLPASKDYIIPSSSMSMCPFKCPSIEYSLYSPTKHSEIDGPSNQTPS